MVILWGCVFLISEVPLYVATQRVTKGFLAHSGPKIRCLVSVFYYIW